MSYNEEKRWVVVHLSRMARSLLGSGSPEQDGQITIVAMKKEEETRLVHRHRF
jgi:hypothetical protein